MKNIICSILQQNKTKWERAKNHKVYAECNDTILERKEEQGTTQYPANADG